MTGLLHSRRRGLDGFTLVELLVVIGVIAVLVSLLLPVLSRALDASRRVTCANNLRQIHVGLVAYATDNFGGYPPPCPGTADGAYDFKTAEGGSIYRLSGTVYNGNWKVGYGWLLARRGSRFLTSGDADPSAVYIPNFRVFYCPSMPKKEINSVDNVTWWTTADDVDGNFKHTPQGGDSVASNYTQWNAFAAQHAPYVARRTSDNPRMVITGDKLGWWRNGGRWGLEYRDVNTLIQNHSTGGNFLFNAGNVEFHRIKSATDKGIFRVTGSSNGNTAYWYAYPDHTKY